MVDIKEIVDVEIDILSTSVIAENFDLLMILGTHKVFVEKFKVYSDISSMISDGFLVTDPEYIAATKVFGQDLAVNQIYVGRRESDSLVATVNVAQENTDYLAIVSGIEYKYTSGETPTAEIIAAGMVAALSDDTVVNALDNYDGTYKVSSKVGDTFYDVTVDSDQTVTINKAKISVDTVLDSTDYTTTINGTPYIFNSGAGATAISIAAGLVALIAADPYVDVIDNLDGTYVITGKAANTFVTLAVDVNQSYQVEIILITISTVSEAHTYSTQIDAVAHTYLSDVTPTVENIAEGLVTAINDDVGAIVTATDNLDGTYDVENKVVGTIYTFATDTRQSFVATPSQSIVDDVTAIKELDNTWFGLIETSHVKADVLLLATWCQANKKLFGTVSNDADIINKTVVEDTTSIPAQLLALNYNFSYCIYNATPADFADAALMGRQFAQIPGASTWALKTLVGITADNLSETQSKNARDKHCNTYETIGSTDATRDGKVFDNKYIYIDVTRDIEWLKVEIQKNLFAVLVAAEKIPYTDGGIAMMKGYLSKQLDIAVANEILSASPAPIVSAPKAKDVPLVDKQDRILRQLNFVAELANAIAKVQIRGTVSF